jgi:hypothetical protein
MAVKSLAQSSLLQPSAVTSLLGDYEGNYFHHLETVRLSSSAASVTFSNLEQYSDYQHLQVRYTSRVSETIGGAGTFYVNLNSDTGANYARHQLRGNGSSVSSSSLTSTASPDVGFTTGAESAANIFGVGSIDILDPFETTKTTTIRSLTGLSSNYNTVCLGSVVWLNTAALTSLQFETYGAHNFVGGSRFSLYGIKAR